MFKGMSLLDIIVVSFLALSILYYLVWMWRNSDPFESKRKRRKREEEFKMTLEGAGYWQQIESTKKHYGNQK